MRTKLLAAGAAIALAFSLTACGPRPQQQCVDPNGTQYVCEEDDDDDDHGWLPVFIPWIQPHNSHKSSPAKPYVTPKPAPKPVAPAAPRPPAMKAPAPVFKAPSYPSYKSPARGK
jgi:hypothetical protein